MRLTYLRELEERRAAVIASVTEQGKLTDELRKEIEGADSKARLEDLYLPYKPKRRTRAQIAREAGLEPLADGLLADPSQAPDAVAASFVNAEKGVAGREGRARRRARHSDGALGRERRAHRRPAQLAERHRPHPFESGRGQGEPKARSIATTSITPSRSRKSLRIACWRCSARSASRFSRWSSTPAPEPDVGSRARRSRRRAPRAASRIAAGRRTSGSTMPAASPGARSCICICCWICSRRRASAPRAHAITVFGDNLKDLLLAAPAGPRAVLGLDPGLRTGVKVAVVDRTGKLVATDTIYPHQPKNQWDQSLHSLLALCAKHGVQLIAIGNGTASRETDKLAGELIKKHPELKVQKIVVSEAGASVYSASELAAKEFPTLDVSLRGAVSIARRLQDPLAELVKIEPKAIGVGQYQHDVNPHRMAKALDAKVEDCVNAVGVLVNSASAALLSRVSGLSSTVADNIIKYRDEHGPFKTRKALLEVPRLGPKVYEQCAGFLRIADGDQPLDASSVHPEAYPVVERIVKSCGREVKQLIGDGSFLRTLKPEKFTDEQFGVPTVRDILKELEKPGRDPRPEFKAAQFAEGVESLEDLKPGMILEGVVSNVAAFGAFVDIGVHQDGLIHISALSDTYVKDPREVVKAGDIVKVRVVEVDLQRKRIALSRRLEVSPSEQRGGGRDDRGGARRWWWPTTNDRPGSKRRVARRRLRFQPVRGGGGGGSAEALQRLRAMANDG